MPELKPCPFCGGTDFEIQDLSNTSETWITCEQCKLETRVFKNKQDAINFWNTRREK